MTQRPQEPTEVPSDAPASPGRSVRVPALASAGAAVVFALLGFLGATPATGLTGALVLGGGLLAGAAAVPRAGRVTVPAAVVATVGAVGVLQAVAASRGVSALVIAAAALAVLTWVAAVVVAFLDTGAVGARAPRPAAAPQAPAWAPVEGWQPSAYPADPTMTYVGQQPTGQQPFAPGHDLTLVGRGPGAQPDPAGVPLFAGAQPSAQASAQEPAAVLDGVGQTSAPEPTAVFGGVGQAAEAKAGFGGAGQSSAPEPTAVFGGVGQAGEAKPGFGQSPQTGEGKPGFGQSPQADGAGVFGSSSQTGAPDQAAAYGSLRGASVPAAAFGSSGQAGAPDQTAVYGQSSPSGGPEPTAVFGQSPSGAGQAGAAFGPSSPSGGPEPTAVFGQSPSGAGQVGAVFGPSSPRGGPEPTAVFGKAGAPELATAFGEAKPGFGQSPQTGEPAAAFGAGQPRAGGPEPTAVSHGGVPESARPQPGAPTTGATPLYGQPPTGTHRAPGQEGAAPLFAGRPQTGARADTPGQPLAQPTPDVPLFGAASLGHATSETSPFGTAAAGQTGHRPGAEAPPSSPSSPFGLAGTGQAASSAHHEPVQDASVFDRAPSRETPLFGVSGVGRASSAHHEPVQDASAFDRPPLGPAFGGERGQEAARPQSGAHRAPVQDGSAPFGGGPGRNGSPAGPPARTSDAQGVGLFGAGPASGAHRAPSESGSANGRPRGESGPHRAPTSGTNGSDVGEAARGVNGASRDGAVPSQRAGTEASGPSYQQATRRRRAGGEAPFGATGGEGPPPFGVAGSPGTGGSALFGGEGPSSPFDATGSPRAGGSAPFGGAVGSGAAAGGDPAQPSHGRPGSEAREAPLPGRRSAERGSGDADPTPETTAFPVQQAPTADPAPAWGQQPPAGQDATMVAAPGWLGAAQPAPDPAGPPGPRRAARHGEGRHGQPEH